MGSSLTASEWLRHYRGRRVLVTGHTGFKGAWASLWLHTLGARVFGLSLQPSPAQATLFTAIGPASIFEGQAGSDVRDATAVRDAVAQFQPDTVLHLAAQSLVRLSYAEPVGTFAANVMGTVHVLEAARQCPSVRSIVIVTSDKCYENREQIWPYREIDALGGYDPYSASKGAAEIVAASYIRSYFAEEGKAACATARAGNVIGGGDFSADRIVPDYVRAMRSRLPLKVRNPDAIRPWQHVLEPIGGYLKLAAFLASSRSTFSGGWNFGPLQESTKTVRQLTQTLDSHAGILKPYMEFTSTSNPHEAKLLSLDISKARTYLGWSPHLSFDETVNWTIAWYIEQMERPEQIVSLMRKQVADYSDRFGT